MSATSVVGIARRSLNWTIAFSILMIFAGIAAIAMPPVAGFAVNIVVAWLLLFSGAMHLVFAWYTRTAGAAVWEVLRAWSTAPSPSICWRNPFGGPGGADAGAGHLPLSGGGARIHGVEFFAAAAGAGWLLFDGVVTLILAVMIWRTWPSSTEWVIGTLVGISMLFSGIRA